MLNFTVGPVQASDEILKIGSEQVPYFRTSEFSSLLLENEKLIKKFTYSDESSKVVFITGSGTASMEASVINTLNKNDRALVVNGGSFGHRFNEILTIHSIPFDEIKLRPGEALTSEILNKYNPNNYTVFIVNIHETSTGVHYDLGLIHNFCKQNNLFLIVDAISSFLADEINLKKYDVDVMITGSQKALACPPGISVIVLSKRALSRINETDPKCLYLNLKSALINAERGQTPFTPAVGILRQINLRLKQIDQNGGAQEEINHVSKMAKYFRERIQKFPFKFLAQTPSNAVTALYTPKANAEEIFLELKDHYDIWICPNGGELNKTVFRVGHIGNLTERDYDKLIKAFEDLEKRGII